MPRKTWLRRFIGRRAAGVSAIARSVCDSLVHHAAWRSGSVESRWVGPSLSWAAIDRVAAGLGLRNVPPPLPGSWHLPAAEHSELGRLCCRRLCWAVLPEWQPQPCLLGNLCFSMFPSLCPGESLPANPASRTNPPHLCLVLHSCLDRQGRAMTPTKHPRPHYAFAVTAACWQTAGTLPCAGAVELAVCVWLCLPSFCFALFPGDSRCACGGMTTATATVLPSNLRW